jgi:hypothetical protein
MFSEDSHGWINFFCPGCGYNNNPNKKRDYLTKNERYKLLKRFGWRCSICGDHVDFKGDYGNVAHIDHIHPIAKAELYPGFIGELKNLQVLCQRCNLSKRDNEQRYCPTCKHPLEIVIFNVDEHWKDYNPKDIEKAYFCNCCDSKGGKYNPALFSKEEIENNKETLKGEK